MSELHDSRGKKTYSVKDLDRIIQSSEYKLLSMAELIKNMVRADMDGQYGQLLIPMAVNYFCQNITYMEWHGPTDRKSGFNLNSERKVNHTIKNMLISHGNEDSLGCKKYEPEFKMLLKAALAASEAGQSTFDFTTVCWIALEYCLEEVDVDNLSSEWRLFNKGLRERALKAFQNYPNSEGLIGVIHPVMQTFLESNSASEYFAKMLSNETDSAQLTAKEIFLGMSHEKVFKILEMFASKEPSQLIERLVQEISDGGVKNFSELKEIRSRGIPQSVEEGIFVDFSNTLVEMGQLNEWLLKAIREWSAAGMKVTVFTGGDPGHCTELLNELGVNDIKVSAKSEYKGKLLQLLIDDLQPVFQGLQSVSHLKPPEEPVQLVCESEQWKWKRI